MTLAFKQRLALYDPNMNDLKSRAKFGIIPAYLHADHIAELWVEGTEFSKEAYQRFIKEQIEDGKLACLGDTSGMSVQEKDMATRLYMVNRTEFKKWLQNNEEWPLPEKCLLARWWDSAEWDEEADTLQAAATKQQEKAIQVLINRVVKAHPEAKPVDVWNKLKEYDSDGIIEEQEPERIETIAGNEDAY